MPAAATPEEAYNGLRSLALSARSLALGLGELGPRVPFGVLMETRYPVAVATLVCFGNGETSLYFSNGGGLIGAGAHESVAVVAKALVAAAAQYVPLMRLATDAPMPADGMTVFHVLTNSGTYNFTAREEELGRGQSALSPLFHAAHEVITALRPLMESSR